MRRLAFIALLAAPLMAVMAPPSPVLAQAATAQAANIAPWREGDRTLGAADAPVTLTVYVSTVCGHCADWHTNELPAFRARHVDTGHVRVVFRDLPTPPVDLAIAGAVIARCAPEDRYDHVLDALFRGQAGLSDQAVPVNQRVTGWLAAAGEAGGMSLDQTAECLRNDALFEDLEAREAQSVADGATGTPTFFLNGRRLTSAQARDADALDALIQPLLAAH